MHVIEVVQQIAVIVVQDVDQCVVLHVFQTALGMYSPNKLSIFKVLF